ncbi:ABC transporter ATP-binding protein [Haloarcula sp. GH36]|uniref:ABC transporter ATP-binding protein n=1 Tax=Haloarcula montana TaxID=3111776 RepID=UPI002D7819C8|nr:ABC transporter ATP-binding protein [Haloarcula sp. GH36]
MTQINIEGLVKKYEANEEHDVEGNEIVAVDNVDLEIQDEEFLVLVGPSGCGKTTMLRCIAGLESVTEGSIRFDDDEVSHLPASDRNVAMVFQNYALYPHMTVRQNLGFGLKLSTKLPSAEIDQQVTSIAEMMGIEELLSKTPGELSGGQQQRVALGRAIVREPEVFLMDEPLSNLDAKLRSEMRTEIQELQNDLGVTTAYVTHDQTEAMAMGDRIAVVNDGTIQQVGVPEELYLNPANEFVADFIGSPSINLLTMEVSDNRLVFQSGFSYEFADYRVDDVPTVRLGVRPEDLEIDQSGDDIEVTVVEKMGNENFIYGILGEKEIVARTDSAVRPEAGDRVGISFAEESVYLFDVQTGDALKTKTDQLSMTQMEM